MDQTLIAKKAGYKDFEAYCEDANLLFLINQGQITAEEAITAREERQKAEQEAKRAKLDVSAKAKPKKRRRLTSQQYMLNDIAEAKAREKAWLEKRS
jgi:hypothetical protein